MPVTTPTGTPFASNIGPCSICDSRNAVIGNPNARFSSPGKLASVLSSASEVFTPSASSTANICSIGLREVKASEPIIPGEKREPSSFNHTAISNGT